MHLIQIPPDSTDGQSPLQVMWPMLAPLLQKAVDYSDGATTLEETAQDLVAKRKQLWVVVTDDKAVKAALVSNLQRFSTGIVQASILLLGGEQGHLKDIMKLLPEFEAWAKTEGCNRVRFLLRKGWAKHLPEYDLAAYVMVKSI